MHVPPPDSLFLYELVRYRAKQPSSGRWIASLPPEIFQHDLQLSGLETLLERLRRGEEYTIGTLKFECREDDIFWFPDTRVFYDSATIVIAQIEALRAFCKEVEVAGVTPENGLLTFLGDTYASQQLVLGYLAHSQVIQDPDVAKCWESILIGVSTDFLHWSVFVVAEIRDAIKDGGSRGYEDIVFDPYGDIVDVGFVFGSGTCSRWEFVKELDILLQRFYDAI